jgi:type II secretion system protein G
MNATLLSLALFWIGASAEEAPRAPTAAAGTARSEEKGPKQELPWGEPVEGLQCRLRADKVTWTLSELKQPGGAVRCKVDFRNRSNVAWSYLHPPLASQHVEWDGKWHVMRRRIPATLRPLEPGEAVRDVDFFVGADVIWAANDSPDRAEPNLAIGWHTIRAAIGFESGDRQIKVVSNPVKIRIIGAHAPPRPHQKQTVTPPAEPTEDEPPTEPPPLTNELPRDAPPHVSEPGAPAKEPSPRVRPETGPERGTFLFIRTKPGGAKVLIDGKYVGLSDDLFPVDPGVRRIVVELEGHDPNGREVTVRTGTIERVKLLLTKRSSARAGVPPSQAPPDGDTGRTRADKHQQPSPNWPLLQGGYVLTPSTVLDLANRQIISYQTPGIDLKRVQSCLRTGRGDLYYEHDLLGCMRGCTAGIWRHTEFVKPTVESVEPELGLTLYRVAPGSRLLISTPEKKHFEVTLLGEIRGQMLVKYKQADPVIVPKSQPPEAAPDDTTPWGEPVEGIQCRLRAERVTWHVAELGRSGQAPEDVRIRMQLKKAILDHQQQQEELDQASRLRLEELIRELQALQSSGRPFGLKLDIRSRSKRTWYAIPPAGDLNVEWDGKWVHAEFLGENQPWPIRPGSERLDCPVHLGRIVAPPNGPAKDGAQIKPTLGWHTARLAVSLSSDGRRISVVSNPVKIQIVDGEAEADVPKKVQGKPIIGLRSIDPSPAPERTLIHSLAFGPTQEHLLLDRRSDKDCYIDFDTGTLFGKPRPDDKSAGRIDAGASLEADTAALLSLGMSVFPVDNRLWDDGSPLAILNKTVSDKPGRPIMEARGSSIQTYLFKTPEGAAGILQILGMTDDEPKGIRIRYKLVVETPADANLRIAQSQIKSLRMALARYSVDVGEFPSSEAGLDSLVASPKDVSPGRRWEGPYVRPPLPTDPWGNPYRYRFPGKRDPVSFDLWSDGPDGKSDTDDDIRVSKEM